MKGKDQRRIQRDARTRYTRVLLRSLHLFLNPHSPPSFLHRALKQHSHYPHHFTINPLAISLFSWHFLFLNHV